MGNFKKLTKKLKVFEMSKIQNVTIKKSEKAITLIALVITIIILLILAGVSIAMLTGENGILRVSKEAKVQTEIGQEKEIVTMSVMGLKTSNKEMTKEDLQEELNGQTENTTVYEDGDDNFIVQFEESGRLYSVDAEGKVKMEDSNILYADSSPGKFEGTGSKDDPFIIMSIEDLVYFSQNVNNYTNKTIQLGRSLNFKSKLSYCDYTTKDYNEYLEITDDVGLMEALTNREYAGFKPISQFKGTFEGKGYVIKNLFEHNSGDAGLFDNCVGTIKDLEITGEILCEGDYAGGIVSRGGTIQNCISRVNIASTGRNTGGISGYNSELTNCQNYGTINGTDSVCGISCNGVETNCQNYGIINGETKVAGISSHQGNQSNCQNYGAINGTNKVGGINATGGGQSNCQNYGTINGVDGVGGIQGAEGGYGDWVIQCINYGKVLGENNVGGIKGVGGNIKNSLNCGDIEATSGVGGLSGLIQTETPIINSYNLGEIIGKKFVGGIVGRASFTQNEASRIINCYTIGEIQGENYLGGIVGRKDGYGTHYIEHCYWPAEFGLEACSGTTSGPMQVTDSVAYKEEYMQGKEVKEKTFIEILNEYVTSYNETHKEESNFIELLTWEKDEETGYPKLNI